MCPVIRFTGCGLSFQQRHKGLDALGKRTLLLVHFASLSWLFWYLYITSCNMLHWAMNRTTPPQVPFLPVCAKAVSMVGPHSTPLVRSLMMNWPCTFWVLLVWSFCRSHRFSGWSTWTEEEDKQDLLSQSGVVLAPSAICSCWYKKTINGVFGTGLLTCGEKKFRFPVRKVFVICAVEKALGS